MNNFNIKFEYEYVSKLVFLNWNDILFGLENNFFDLNFLKIYCKTIKYKV